MHYYDHYCGTLNSALERLEITDAQGQSLGSETGMNALQAMTQNVQRADASMFLVGNGASAAFASHMALDWTKNGRVRTHAFNDSALLTAMGNDLGYEDAFSAPLGWYAESGDMLVTISSSGSSPNILKCIATARDKGLQVVTLSGFQESNPSRGLGDLNFYVPARTYGIVECAHQVLLHVWLDAFMGVEEWSLGT